MTGYLGDSAGVPKLFAVMAGSGEGHMGGMNGWSGWGHMGGMWIWWILGAALIAAVVWAAVRRSRNR